MTTNTEKRKMKSGNGKETMVKMKEIWKEELGNGSTRMTYFNLEPRTIIRKIYQKSGKGRK